MKLVVTGAAGGLGRAFLAQVDPAHEISAFTHGDLDIADADAVTRTIEPIQPDAILNFAAFTRVDACETEPEAADAANAKGPAHLAAVARATGSVLLHVSTDYVFDGEKGSSYDENDTPNPQSVYAVTKLAGEDAVRSGTEKHYVVRTGFVFGGGTDFLSGALSRLRAGAETGGLADRIGSPTYVQHLAARILPLATSGRFGTYHLAGPEATTWFDVLARLRQFGGLSGVPVRQTAEELGLPAPRPHDSSLVSVYAGAAGIEPMPPLDDALKEFMDARG